MRTVIDGVQMSVSSRQLLPKFFVNLNDQVLREIASGNPCLIGHQNCFETVSIEHRDCLGRPWINLEARQMIDVTHFLADRPVTVDEYTDVLHGLDLVSLRSVSNLSLQTCRTVEH